MEHKASCNHILCSCVHSRPLGWGRTVKTFFLNVAMLHIKFKGFELRAPSRHMFRPYTDFKSLSRVIKSNKILNVVMLHIELKKKKYRLTWKRKFDLTHTRPLVQVESSNIAIDR